MGRHWRATTGSGRGAGGEWKYFSSGTYDTIVCALLLQFTEDHLLKAAAILKGSSQFNTIYTQYFYFVEFCLMDDLTYVDEKVAWDFPYMLLDLVELGRVCLLVYILNLVSSLSQSVMKV